MSPVEFAVARFLLGAVPPGPEFGLDRPSVVTFRFGAYASEIMDGSLRTHVLGRRVRECASTEALTLADAVRRRTYNTNDPMGHARPRSRTRGHERRSGGIRPRHGGPGMPEVVHDLPAGAKRLKQVARGIRSTIVNGEVLLENNEHTGATAGRLFRGLRHSG